MSTYSKRENEVYKLIEYDFNNLPYKNKKTPLTPNWFFKKKANEYKIEITNKNWYDITKERITEIYIDVVNQSKYTFKIEVDNIIYANELLKDNNLYFNIGDYISLHDNIYQIKTLYVWLDERTITWIWLFNNNTDYFISELDTEIYNAQKVDRYVEKWTIKGLEKSCVMYDIFTYKYHIYLNNDEIYNDIEIYQSKTLSKNLHMLYGYNDNHKYLIYIYSDWSIFEHKFELDKYINDRTWESNKYLLSESIWFYNISIDKNDGVSNNIYYKWKLLLWDREYVPLFESETRISEYYEDNFRPFANIYKFDKNKNELVLEYPDLKNLEYSSINMQGWYYLSIFHDNNWNRKIKRIDNNENIYTIYNENSDIIQLDKNNKFGICRNKKGNQQVVEIKYNQKEDYLEITATDIEWEFVCINKNECFSIWKKWNIKKTMKI